MKKKSRVITMILAIAMTASILAGCGEEDSKAGNSEDSKAGYTEGSKANSASSESKSTEAPKKKYTISVFTTRVTPVQDTEVMKKIEEMTGHKFEVSAVPDQDYGQKLNLFVASNQMPDIYDGYSLPGLKAAATLTEEELKQYLPGTYKSFTDRVSKYGFKKDSILESWSVDGKLKGFNNGNLNNATPYGAMIRKDILDELGQKMPVTINDWDGLLKAYKAKYPDRYPIAARGKDAFYQSFYYFYASFGVSYNTWLLRDNKLVFGPFLPEMREFLALMQKWYKAGYINPEWFAMDMQAMNSELVNGNLIYSQFYSLKEKANPPYDPGKIPAQLLAKNPNAKLEWVSFPIWKEGAKPTLSCNRLFAGPTCFGGHLESDKDKFHAVMSVWDRMYNDKDLYILRRYGIEGKHYDLVNGIPVQKELYTNYDAQGKEGFGWIFAGQFDPSDEIMEAITPDYVKQNMENLINKPDGIYNKSKVEYGFSRVTGVLTSPSGEDIGVKNVSKMAQWNSTFTAVIIGQKSLTDFDNFIAEWKKEIGDQLTEAANRLYLKQWLN